MTASNHISFRVSSETRRQIQWLQRHWSENQTQVIVRSIERIYQQEKATTMRHEFKTKQEALAAGYTPVDRLRDRDVSGYNSFGYAFTNAEGQKTVDVWLSEEINRINRKGAVIPMYPPYPPKNPAPAT